MSHPPDHIPELDSPRQSRSPIKKDKKERVSFKLPLEPPLYRFKSLVIGNFRFRFIILKLSSSFLFDFLFIFLSLAEKSNQNCDPTNDCL